MTKLYLPFIAGLCLFILTGCGTYVPEGSTVVKVKNSRIEFDRADLLPRDELRDQTRIRMKWYDTNTYITTATLSPGIYSFQGRSYEGGGIARDFEVVAGQNYYEIDTDAGGSARSRDSASNAGAIPLTGKLNIPSNRLPPTVSVLFIGQNIAMETVEVNRDGTFAAQFPGKGNWRVEVHITGQQPLSYTHPTLNVQGPVDLGIITLK